MRTFIPMSLPRAAVMLAAFSVAAHAQFRSDPGSPFPAGPYPISVAVGDFNGDGKPDLAMANVGYNGTVTILLGNGMGGFTPAPGSPFQAGNGPVSVAVADFNGDGKLDLAIAASNNNAVTVLFGNGSGGFTRFQDNLFPVGLSPQTVVVGDINGDGKPDFATANYGDGTITVMLGNGRGGFTQAPGSPFPSAVYVTSLAVGDLNGDGRPDLVFANGYGVTVMLGDGTGRFAAASGTVLSGGTFVTLGDFNGDGKPDLAVTGSYGNSVTILLGDGTGGFTPAPGSPFGAGSGPGPAVVGDFNGDGKPDLAIVDFNDDTVTLLLGDGTGWFITAPGNPFKAGANLRAFAVADFNGDGKSDLAIPNYLDQTVTVLLGGSPTTMPLFTTPQGNPFPAEINPFSVAIGDFNGDGSLDLAIAGQYNVTASMGNGKGGFTASSGGLLDPEIFPLSIAVGDFNGDGNPDLVIADDTALSKNVRVLLGNGRGGFTAAPGKPFVVGRSPGSVAVGDFNADGNLDLAVADSDDNNVTVLLGDGTGGFSAASGSPFPAGSDPQSVVVGDFNGDGKPDLAIANGGSSNVTVLLGNGTGGFAAAPGSPVPVGSGPRSLAVGDFNGDGKLDLAVANYNDNTVTVLLGDGMGGFTARGGPLRVGSNPSSAAVADFNGDGKPDLAVANYKDNTVTVLLGDGTGGFTAVSGSPFPVGVGPNSVAVGDFNSDGEPDLVTTNYKDNTVTVLLNGVPPLVTLISPGSRATGVSLTPTLTWSTPTGATSYDVYFGARFPPPLVTRTTGTSYSPGTLGVGVTYFWRVVATSAGGASTSATWSFATQAPLPAAPVLISPANGAAGVLVAPALVWKASSEATAYDVYFGPMSRPVQVTSTTATSYAPPVLNSNTTYYWRIAAVAGGVSVSSETRSFTTGSPAAGLRFVPVGPCRVADTRNPDGPFGGPTMTAGSTRSFAIPQSPCNIPSTAQAYSLNVTAVPDGPLSYLTLWPSGQTQPFVSTLNSLGGSVVANASIVPAGSGGAVSVYATDPADVILDINGYFDSIDGAALYSFYPATPCRVADTRNPTGQFGGPTMYAGETRDFPLSYGSCGLPYTAGAYSLNVTAVPATSYLGYLTTWPTGWAQPNVSTLNSWTGKVVANAAVVPAGLNSSISVFVTEVADVVLDIDGYFGLPGKPGELLFYRVAPCRVADTRDAGGPFGGPEMGAGDTRSFTIPTSGCNIPSTAAAYSVNVTVVPDGVLSYLTIWPTGAPQPLVSTLNSWDGSVVANAAIVPAGTDGAISIFVTNPTHVIVDINGYLAP